MVPHKRLLDSAIEECMSKFLASVTSDSLVQEGSKIMTDQDLRSVLVKENDKYVGILTETDLLFEVLIERKDPKTTKVSDIMTRPLITLEQDKTLMEAIELMRDKNIKHLVVTRKGKIVGMLSVRDLISFSMTYG